jgi:hypothetical protein
MLEGLSGLREFYLTINEVVCAMATASNPETQWLGLREKTDSVDCCKILVSLDFLVTFLSRKK